MAELNINVTLEQEVISNFYKQYKGGISSETIQTIKNNWSRLIPPEALRLTLTLQQAAGSGLTTYLTIKNTIDLFPDFPWGVISCMIPLDVERFYTALNTIGNNYWFGFNQDLKEAKSTNFKNLGYVCKELMIKVAGDNAIAGYQGWAYNIPFRAKIDEIISEYANQKAEGSSSPEMVQEKNERVIARIRDTLNLLKNE